MATRGPSSHLDQIDQQRARLEELLRAYFLKPEEAVRPPRLMDGHQLMTALDLPPGPLIGQLLQGIEEAQAEGRLRTTDEALALAREVLKAHVR
ncbi:MAG: polynucleotide adenylyltransferase, partial [Candidatus Omnitrophica bacterium]|nr:polynucleotide adenylyltransferase [Candidatus Omnitrophota bacterium]